MPTFTQSVSAIDAAGVRAYIVGQFPNTPLTMQTAGSIITEITMPTLDQTTFDSLIATLQSNFPAAMNIGDGYSVPFSITPASAAITWSAMPAAVTEFLGLTIHRTAAYFVPFTQARVVVNVQTAGSTGSKLSIQGSIDGGTTWVFLDGSANANGSNVVAIDTTGINASSVMTIPVAGRISNIILRCVGGAGNGVTSPAFGTIELQVR